MKRGIITAFALLFLSAPITAVLAAEPPDRPATPVDDVFEPYTADDWIVSPDEEEMGDEDADGMPELDIYAIIACWDDEYLRVDILLNDSVDFEHNTFFAIKVEYEGSNEYYTYYTATEQLIYEKEKDGKITQRTTLGSGKSKDIAGVTDSADLDAADIYFFITKADHIGGKKGREYFLTCSFFSGYVTAKNELYIADQTIPVNVQFTY